jgi:hypothetical protein
VPPSACGLRPKRRSTVARHALLIGVSEFADQRLNRLNAPTNDVIALRRILQDAARGKFDGVEMSINEDFLAVRDRLAKLYQDRAPDDLLLLYYSGHGILDRGRLFLATAGSNLDAPRARSLAAGDVRDFMHDCRAERQIVVLDCCHSGAFAERAKAGGPAPAVTPDTFVGGEAGTYVLTASDAMQLAWDGDELRSGDGSGTSRFTAWLVDGLEGGEAAPDDDQISMDALYRYLFRRARSEGAPSTPQRFVHGGVGDPVISQNPLAGSGHVAPALKEALAAADYRLRLGAVTELAQQLRGSDKVLARGARRLLEQHLAQERDFAVRTAIGDVLAATSRPAEPPAAAPQPETAAPPPPHPEPRSASPTVSAPTYSQPMPAPTLSLADRWHLVPLWAQFTFFLCFPLGFAWLASSASDPMPRWVKPAVIAFWVLMLIYGVADGLSRP